MRENTSIEKAIPLLAEEIEKNRLSVFVGAGCSIAAGLPTWAKLLDDLLTRYNIKTKESNLLRLASRLERELKKTKFREEVITSLKVAPEATTPVCETLVSLGVNSYITTNYDHVLENSFRKNSVEPTTITQDENLPSIDPTKKHIVKLHGDINSPNSLIITSRDYTKYKSNHPGFIEWLTADMSRNTMLFLGTSFDDPRLSEADDHVINLFDDMKRPHFIVLKSPDPSSIPSEEYEDMLGDFEATCEDFNERGFFVISIDDYREIEQFLKKLHEKVLSNKIKKDPTDFKSKAFLQAKQIGELETTLSGVLDNKTRKLCEYVNGEGRLPSCKERFNRTQKLIAHLENPPAPLLAESLTEGWFTVTDAYISYHNRENLAIIKKYFEKVQSFYNDIQGDRSELQNKLKRLQAKILFFGGEIEQAINTVADSEDPKTIYFWLALLLDCDRTDEAYRFITSHPIQPEWLNVALCTFILSGKIQDAEQLFSKTKDEIESLKDSGELDNSPYKNEFFYEKICFSMAETCYRMVFRLCGSGDADVCYPNDVNNEGARYLSKSLYYIDLLVENFKQGGENSYYYIEAKKIELFASYLIQNFDRADNVALELIEISALSHDLIDFILGRKNCLTVEIDFKELTKKLAKGYLEKVWAIIGIADIEASILKNKNKAWQFIKKAADLAVSISEKEHLAKAAFEISQQIEKTSQTSVLIKNLLPNDNLWQQFFKACFLLIDNQTEKAEKIFSDLKKRSPSPEIAASIKTILANKFINENKWLEARKSLEESLRIQPNLNTLKILLRTLATLQDDQEAYNVAKELESQGRGDEQVTATKAQAARNLNLLAEAEQSYSLLVKKKPLEPEYAFKLADVLLQQDELSEALATLHPFIDCHSENFNLNCLYMACELHSMQGDDEEALQLLEKCFGFIKDEPQLLMRHLDLCFRTGPENEKKAIKSQSRLQILKQEGKISDELFAMKGVDDVVEILKQRHETAQKIDMEYRTGRVARLMVCEWRNKPLYLDWAVRTQELSLNGENPSSWVNFTVYATNGIRVDMFENRNQLVQYSSPSEAKEIVVDYHALITIHRLGLLERLNNAFSKIYYPQILKLIWRVDQKQFRHHQPSQEIIYHSLNEKIELGQIREIVAPEPSEGVQAENNSPLKRNLRLAKLEELPLLDAYDGKKEFEGYQDVYRVTQIIRWLYKKGKLSENKLSELEKITAGSHNIIKEATPETLDKVSKLLVDITTLEILEQNGLVQLLLDLGIQIIVEKFTADNFRRAVLELRFGERVGKWHQDLAKTVKSLPSFQGVSPQYDVKKKAENFTNKPHLQALLDCLVELENKKSFLLTDDRFMQMAVDQRHRNKSFGTDILLKYLYEKDIISLKEYADKFLQLCKWRYRFLIPDTRILVYFAHEFKTNPPGTPLQIIGNYGRDCMKDPGLFMGEETTEPPMPIGVKFQMTWVTAWTEFLCTIWQDDGFNEECLEYSTRDVFMRFMPDLPSGIKPAFRYNFVAINNKSIVMTILITATTSKTPTKLHGLLKQIFDIFQFNERQQNNEIESFLESILLNATLSSKEDEQNIRILFAVNVLRTFYGEERPDISFNLVPVLKKIGLTFSDNKPIIPKDLPVNKKQDSPFKNRAFHRKDMPEYIPDGPMIITELQQKEKLRILIPHHSIRSPLLSERSDVLDDILRHNDISVYSKQKIERKRESVLSPDEISWQPATNEISNIMLDDFNYCASLFRQLILLKKDDANLDLNQIVNEAWNGVFKFDTRSITSTLPLLLHDPFEDKTIVKRVKNEIADLIRSVQKQKVSSENILHMLFDWYLENVYFAPVSPPLNPSSVIISALDTLKGKPTGWPTSRELLQSVQLWLKDKIDPFAYLISFELILYARLKSGPSENEVFTQETFYSEFDQIFELLLSLDDDIAPTSIKMIHAAWEMRKVLAKYYLRYLDLHDSSDMKDDKKVALSWWMAREVCAAIVKSAGSVETEDSANWLKLKTKTVISEQERFLNFTHSVADRREFFSLGRYYTLEENSSPFVVATLALMRTDAATDKPLLDGLKKPTTILSPEIRNKIIDKLSVHAFLGNGQLRERNKGELSFLWDISLCTAATNLLREYYGDAINFLGKAKLANINFAESTSKDDFLKEELVTFPEQVQQKSEFPVVITLAAFKAYLLSRGELPESADIFAKELFLARDISQFDTETGWASIYIFTQILKRLYAANNYKWAKIFGDQISKINYESCHGKNLVHILKNLAITVLMGYDYSILKPLLELKMEHKDIRQSLGEIKAGLEYVFPRIPLTYQENARKILNDLTDIPVPNISESNEGE